MENTILELVDRLLALQARCAVAEDNLKELTAQFQQLEDAVSAKNDRIEKLEQELKIKTDTVVYQLNRYNKLMADYDTIETELNILKGGEPDAGEV